MNIITIALNQLKMTIRNKQIILSIILPIIMIFIMGNALKSVFEANNSIEKFKVLYANEDTGTIGNTFDSMLLNDASKYVEVVKASAKDAREEVTSGKYEVAIAIPKDLSLKVSKGEKCSINVISSGKDEIKDYVVNSLPKLEFQSDLKKLSSFQYFSVGMLLFFMMTTGIGVGNSIIKERSDKIYTRINSFPVKKSEYLLGKVLSSIIISVLQAVTVMLASTLLFGVNWGTNFIGIAVTLLLIILIASSLGVLFSSIVNSEKALSAGLTIVLWFIAFMGGGFSSFPALEPIGKLTFYKWGFNALANFICGGSFNAVINELIMLTSLMVVLWTAALALFNRRYSNE